MNKNEREKLQWRLLRGTLKTENVLSPTLRIRTMYKKTVNYQRTFLFLKNKIQIKIFEPLNLITLEFVINKKDFKFQMSAILTCCNNKIPLAIVLVLFYCLPLYLCKSLIL